MKNRKILLLTFQGSQVFQVTKASNHTFLTRLRKKMMVMVLNTSTKLHIITTTTNSNILNQKR
jgi:hypothetical protein